jgi:hypothetical protein
MLDEFVSPMQFVSPVATHRHDAILENFKADEVDHTKVRVKVAEATYGAGESENHLCSTTRSRRTSPTGRTGEQCSDATQWSWGSAIRRAEAVGGHREGPQDPAPRRGIRAGRAARSTYSLGLSATSQPYFSL